MAVTPFKIFSGGEILTASDLNASFAQVFDNGEDLAWPATQARDFNGVELILDADGDTSITADTDDQIDFQMAGTDHVVFRASATGNAVDVNGSVATTGHIIDIGDADALTTGSILNLVSNSSSTSTRNLINLVNDNTAATAATCLNVQQDASAPGIQITQNGNTRALLISTTATTTSGVIDVVSDSLTTGNAVSVSADALTTGSILNLTSDSTSTSTRNLVNIVNDNTLATATTCLNIQQDGSAEAIQITQISNARSIRIDSSATTTSGVVTVNADSLTTGNAISASANALTTGSILNLTSNSSSSSTRNLVNIVNDNTSATATTCLNIQQDGSAEAIQITQISNARSIRIDSSATTTNGVIDIISDSLTAGNAISVTADALTSGSILNLTSSATDAAARDLVYVENSSSSATGARCLHLTDSSSNSNSETMRVTKSGNGSALVVFSDSTTTASAVFITADGLTTGTAFNIQSSSTSSSSRSLQIIRNSSSSASSTTCLDIQNEADNYVIDMYNNGTSFPVVRSTASSSSYAGNIHRLECDRTASTAYYFIRCVSDADGTPDTEFTFRGDGVANADGSFNGGGADYAEYFEWLDGNPNNEDRRGIAVTLEGNKIKPAKQGDAIIGAVSANPSAVGDGAWNKWVDKYIRDEFGSYILEDYKVYSWTEEILEGDKLVAKNVYIPDYTVTEDTVIRNDAEISIQQKRILNPDWDETLEYIPRENRPEWGCIGLVGKLRIRKGQPTNPNWIKMRDISNSVEEWLVR